MVIHLGNRRNAACELRRSSDLFYHQTSLIVVIEPVAFFSSSNLRSGAIEFGSPAFLNPNNALHRIPWLRRSGSSSLKFHPNLPLVLILITSGVFKLSLLTRWAEDVVAGGKSCGITNLPL